MRLFGSQPMPATQPVAPPKSYSKEKGHHALIKAQKELRGYLSHQPNKRGDYHGEPRGGQWPSTKHLLRKCVATVTDTSTKQQLTFCGSNMHDEAKFG